MGEWARNRRRVAVYPPNAQEHNIALEVGNGWLCCRRIRDINGSIKWKLLALHTYGMWGVKGIITDKLAQLLQLLF